MNREKLHLGLDGKLVTSSERAARPGPRAEVIDCEVWDMGGQHDFRYMHQLLFTRQAIYLAVTMPRSGGSVKKLMEWLDLVDRRTGGEATVIVVSTFGAVDHSLSLDELRREFPRLDLHALHVVNTVVAKDSSIPVFGIDELRQMLAKIIADPAQHYAQTWSSGWTRVFNELREQTDPYLHWTDVQKVCAKHNVEGAEQEILVRTGHLTGAWLWREDTPDGKEVVVLQPQWLNRAVARLVKPDGEVAKKYGLVTSRELSQLWNGKDVDGESFPKGTHKMLLQLLEINELAYRPKAHGMAHGEGDDWLITQMVQELPPKELEDVWLATAQDQYMEAQRVIAFVDPRGGLLLGEVRELIYLLIFRLRSLSLEGVSGKAIHWRRGLVVGYKDKSLARIELKDRELHVTLRYMRSDSLFDLIDTQIGRDDDELWNGLEKRVYLPCGKACRLMPNHQLHGNGRISLKACDENRLEGEEKVNCSSQACGKLVKIADVIPGPQPIEPIALDANVAAMIKAMYLGGTDWQKGVSAKLDELKEVVEIVRDEARHHADDIINSLSTRMESEPCLFSLKPVEKEWWKVSGWTDIEVEITVWCEWSLMPVPFFGETTHDGKPRGKVIVKMQRGWLGVAKKTLQFTKYALLAMKTAGVYPAVVGGAALAATGAATAKALTDAQKEAMEKEIKMLGDFEKALKEETLSEGARDGLKSTATKGEFDEHSLAVRGHNAPLDDKDAVREIRKLFKAKDESWGGLQPVNEESRWYWRHPNWKAFGRKY